MISMANGFIAVCLWLIINYSNSSHMLKCLDLSYDRSAFVFFRVLCFQFYFVEKESFILSSFFFTLFVLFQQRQIDQFSNKPLFIPIKIFLFLQFLFHFTYYIYVVQAIFYFSARSNCFCESFKHSIEMKTMLRRRNCIVYYLLKWSVI